MPEKKWKYIPSIPSEVKFENISLIDLFRNTVDAKGSNKATYFEGKFTTYNELEENVNRLSHALQSLNVRKGDRVAILMPNCPQFIYSFFAPLALGAIVTSISPLLTGAEIRNQLADSGAKVILTMDLFLDSIREIKGETQLEHIIVASVAEDLPAIKGFLYKNVIARKNPKIKNELKLTTLLKQNKNERVYTAMNPKEDVAILQYTGGTTGIQKGAMLTHANLVSQTYIISYWDNWLDEKPKGQYKSLAVLPYSHIFGLIASFLWPLKTGSLIFLIPNPRKPGVLEVMMKLIQEHQIHFFNAVPVLFQKLAEDPAITKYDLSSLKLCIAGGEGLPAPTVEKFESKTGAILIEGYGLSEASPVTHVTPGHRDYRKIGCIGIPIPNTMAMIVNPDTQEEITKEGESGEIWVRGPGVMKGYWNNKEATNKVLVNGWLRTGDMATVDNEGFFTIVDRLKDMIIVSGYKVYPKEVEEVLYNHPAINMVAVIAQEKETIGSTVKACIVAEPGHPQLTLEEVKEFCKPYLAPYKIPKVIEYMDDLPRSPVGKVLRRHLREAEQAKQISVEKLQAKSTVQVK